MARATASSHLPSRQANFALVAFLLAYMLSFVDRQILSLMVDPIRRDLAISDVQMGLLQGFAFALLYAVAGIPLGLVADRIRRKRIIVGGIIFWSIATGMCGLASSFAMLFAARMAVGLGEATLSPAAHSFLSDAFPPQNLSRAMAIYTLGITLGSGAALMIGGSVVDLIASSNALHLPLLGEVPAWKASFLIVALPGLIVAALAALVHEPPRSTAHADGKASGLLPLLSYLMKHRRVFGSLYLSSILLGVTGYGMVGWYPTLLIRSHGYTAGEAGLHMGLIYFLLGSAGSISGGLLAERLALKGRHDANLRVVTLICALLVIPATFAPIMPNVALTFLFLAPAVFVFNGYFGCSVAAIQLATPNRMRATNAAVFLMANSLVGLSVGSAIVPLLDKWVFGGTGHIGPALATVACISTVLAGLCAASGIRAYGDLVRSDAADA